MLSGQPPVSFKFEAIGTQWQIDVFDQLKPRPAAQLLLKIRHRIETFDQNYSRFRGDSLVSKMAQKSGVYTLPSDADQLLSLYRELHQLTNGLFTPLIGQVLVDAGYDATYSLTQKNHLISPPSWDEVLVYENSQIKLNKPQLLDFGAAGKGYLIDLVSEVLEAAGHQNYCIDAGGDILHRSSSLQPLRVGLENPANIQEVIGVCSLSNQSICGSAGNRRTWKNFHHIINPQTLLSPSHILATWVVAKTTILADGLSTCLFFVPARTLIDKYEFEYLQLNSDFSIEKSQAFPAQLFTI